MKKLKSLFLTAFLLCAAFWTSDAQALPLSNGYAPAVIQGETAVISQYVHFDFVRNRDAPNFYPANVVGSTDVVAMGAVYSITKDWVAFAFIPWIHNEARFNNPPPSTGRTSSKASGWSDLAVSVAYRLFDFQGIGWYASSTLQPGIQFPTGSWNQKDNGATLDREFQPGTGNWSGFASWVTSILGTHNEATVQLQYQGFFKGHDFRHGQVFIYNASLGHRIIPWFMKSKTEYPVWATASIEFLGKYKTRPIGDGNSINTWTNWGRIAPTFSLEFTNVFNLFDLLIQGSFQQTIYFKTGDQLPVRPQRSYLAQIAAHW